MVTRSKSLTTMLLSVLATYGCASIATLAHDTGVRIEPISNESGRIRSPGFWTDADGISLRGDVLPSSAGQSPLVGHIDIAITVPDGSNTVCTTTPLITDRRYGGSGFSQPFVSLPPRGSRVRVWYHSVTATHNDCTA